jgi:hypothetical protein
MKRFFWNRGTACVTIFFTWLSWPVGQNVESVVVPVAGSLSVWVIVNISFLFQVERRKRAMNNCRIKNLKTPL